MPNTLLWCVLLGVATTASRARAQAAAPAAPSWMAVDTAARTVRLTLETTRPAGAASAALNGYREGGVQIVVPLRWTVSWEWRSADSGAPHSLVLMAEREKLPTEGGRPAFTNAMTRSVTAGLAAGEVDRTTFEAEETGWFWLLCGVPEHAIAGEWIGLKVDAEAQTAEVVEK